MSRSNPNQIFSPKRKRSLPGTPDPEAQVVALSPVSLMTTNKFVCEICNKGFQRDQNLQLHRRGHNLPWKLRKRSEGEVARRKVYVCPESSCVHHDASRALGDLTGIKKHFSRKHGEKKWRCEKCNKRYAVVSDWKAHSKICGSKEYKCNCGTIFSRKDSFITHRAFCDVLIDDNERFLATSSSVDPNYQHQFMTAPIQNNINTHQFSTIAEPIWLDLQHAHNPNPYHMELCSNYGTNPLFSPCTLPELAQPQAANSYSLFSHVVKREDVMYDYSTSRHNPDPISATSLLRKALSSTDDYYGYEGSDVRNINAILGEGRLTRDFMGVGATAQEIAKFASMSSGIDDFTHFGAEN